MNRQNSKNDIFFSFIKKRHDQFIQGGPLAVVNKVITPLIGVITPVTNL